MNYRPIPATRVFARFVLATALLKLVSSVSSAADDHISVALPAGIKAVWDTARATHESTPTRERICLNGLWRWQPAAEKTQEVPAGAWGFYKVPAPWPGFQDYMTSDYQTLYPHPSWKDAKLAEVRGAWYERTFTVPQAWAGRRIYLCLEYLNSYAAVFVDGHEVGQARFPAGQVDLTPAVRPGETHTLTLLVLAMPLKAVMESYTDTNTARQRQGTVERRGLCGDVWLVSEPAGARLGEVRISTSLSRGEITFRAAVENQAADQTFKLLARIKDATHFVDEFASLPLSVSQLTNAQAEFTANWKAPKQWNIHTPTNQYTAEVWLLDSAGKALDVALPEKFGFREFEIRGRDFFMNGKPIYLSIVPLDNAQVGTALATYDAAKESFRRLQSFGINFVYTHNYGCEPGSHLSFEEILRAADDTGMLVALSQPHFSAYDWKSPDADRTNGYADHAAFYTRVAGNHPSVVSYSMSHNATGYNEDINPPMIDGLSDPRDQWAERNAKVALRCEAIVRGLDPERLVYHHSSGNLSQMYTLNFYPNFVPIQELDDWFEHWSKAGTKPLLLVEYGAPFGWDWTMYRGWYKGKREFGSAPVPWEYCLAEWNAQFIGDRAYRISEREKRNLRWEAEQFRQQRLWHRWDYPTPVGDARMDEMQPVQAAYTTANWRAFRTWGLSGNSPWEHDRFWKLREGFKHQRQDFKVEWDNLQRPGYSPDYLDRTYARFDLAYERSDWIPTATAQSLMTNNLPLLTWIAGKESHFTVRDHLFYPGETVEKQLVVINNSRETLSGRASWECEAVPSFASSFQLVLLPGQLAQVPLKLKLPADARPGTNVIRVTFKPLKLQEQVDSFAFEVLPRPAPLKTSGSIALFDPPGETAKLLSRLGVKFRSLEATNDLSGASVLFIGKGALSLTGPAPTLDTVRDGLKVVVFEQKAEVLEQRLGLKVAEYGFRQVWPRMPDHPLLAGLHAEQLRDWRGSATLLPPTMDYTLNPRYNGAPTVRWCGLEVTRLWRCGTWGNVASVSIEKPQRGDFLPIVEAGYALQYSPLLEYREGRGMLLFCQMDLTGRSESEPAAETLVNNLISYVDAWKPAPRRKAIYAGEAAGLEWLRRCGVQASRLDKEAPAPDQVLVVAPGAGQELSSKQHAIAEWVKTGGYVLALGMDQAEVNSFLPLHIETQIEEHTAARFEPFALDSWFAGVSPADVHNRDPRKIPLVTGGVVRFGNGVLAASGHVIFCQLRPWEFDQTPEHFNQRRTFSRVSFAVSRILGNLGIEEKTPLLSRFTEPPNAGAKPSVLKNGDFATDANGDGLADEWELGSNPKAATCAREPMHGAGWSLMINVPASSSTAKPTETMLAQYNLPITAGQWYKLSVRTKAQGLNSKQVSCTVQNTATWHELIDTQTFAPKAQWSSFSFFVKAKETAEKGTKFQTWFTGPGKLWLSDLRMEPVPDPAVGRWSDGMYLLQPVDWDDPYRFFGW